jgi:hypothetical protein
VEAKPKRAKAGTKATRKEVMKKKTPIIENSSRFNNEISLPPLEELYIVLEATPKNDQWFICFTKAKWQVPNSTFFFPFFFFFLNTSLDKICMFFQVI